MNAFRPPIRTPVGRQALSNPRGLTHVSTVIARLLAMYGIDEPHTPRPPQQAPRPRVPSLPLGQQTFPWFEPIEVGA